MCILCLVLHLFSKEELADHSFAQWWPNLSRYTWSEEFSSPTFSSTKAKAFQNVN